MWLLMRILMFLLQILAQTVKSGVSLVVRCSKPPQRQGDDRVQCEPAHKKRCGGPAQLTWINALHPVPINDYEYLHWVGGANRPC
ncbi:MAG: hypothetical protein OSA97_17315 [Nevskia sp.]|nr:hypothetical protein [Nevskia sp.]